MNRLHALSAVCFLSAIVFFIIGALSGDIEGGIFIVFPFIVGSGVYGFIGVVLLVISFFLFFFGFSSFEPNYRNFNEFDSSVEKKKSIKGGGVVLIGPIPIVFGSSWKIAVILMALSIIIIIISLIAFNVSF